MSPERALRRLIAVVWFIAWATLAGTVSTLLGEGRLTLSLGLWAFWLAPALRARRPGSLQRVAWFAALSLAASFAMAIAFGLHWLDPSWGEFRVLGVIPLQGVSRGAAVGLAALGGAIDGWTLWVASRMDVRALIPRGEILHVVATPMNDELGG